MNGQADDEYDLTKSFFSGAVSVSVVSHPAKDTALLLQ